MSSSREVPSSNTLNHPDRLQWNEVAQESNHLHSARSIETTDTRRKSRDIQRNEFIEAFDVKKLRTQRYHSFHYPSQVPRFWQH